MINKLFISIALAAAVLGGCGDKKAKESGGGGGTAGGGGGGGGGKVAAPAAKLVEIDASPAGESFQGWKLMAPEGVTAKDDFGALGVTDGKGFQLEVHSGTVDMPARKKEIESNDINKLKKFLTDSPDTLVYESDPGMGGVQVHFLAAIKVGGADYSCENAKGPTYTKAQIDAMLAACKSIKK